MTKRQTEADREAATYPPGNHRGTFWNGHRAGLTCKRKDSCPYDETGSKGYRRAWLNGFDFGVREYNRRARA